MRITFLSTFIVLLLPLIFLAGGCQQESRTPPAEVQAFITTASAESRVTTNFETVHFAQRSGHQSDADPFIQPIRLSGDANSTQLVLAPDFDLRNLNPSNQILLFPPDFKSDTRANFHPHGEQVCASGCSASHHPTPKLTEVQFRQLMSRFSAEPLDETSEALESLLYFGRQTRLLLANSDPGQLDSVRLKFLRRELSRTHVLVEFRIIDEHGLIRAELPSTRVPLDRRHVFEMEVTGLPPLVTSGTLKRTGLHHLWTRI